MADYIRREDAIDAFNRAVQDVGILDADDIETVFGMLSPADVVQVVRCKDCKHWDGADTCDVNDAPVWDNDFCSMAERSEQDGT